MVPICPQSHFWISHASPSFWSADRLPGTACRGTDGIWRKKIQMANWRFLFRPKWKWCVRKELTCCPYSIIFPWKPAIWVSKSVSAEAAGCVAQPQMRLLHPVTHGPEGPSGKMDHRVNIAKSCLETHVFWRQLMLVVAPSPNSGLNCQWMVTKPVGQVPLSPYPCNLSSAAQKTCHGAVFVLDFRSHARPQSMYPPKCVMFTEGVHAFGVLLF